MFPVLQTPSSPGLPYVHSIKHVAVTDQGMYTCVARNVVGRAYAAAYLQVNAAPVLGPPLLWVLRHQTCKRCVDVWNVWNGKYNTSVNLSNLSWTQCLFSVLCLITFSFLEYLNSPFRRKSTITYMSDRHHTTLIWSLSPVLYLHALTKAGA